MNKLHKKDNIVMTKLLIITDKTLVRLSVAFEDVNIWRVNPVHWLTKSKLLILKNCVILYSALF